MDEKSIERFWAKVDTSGDCWIWTACKHWRGYGFFGYKGKNKFAHRISYELAYGPIPEGIIVCHHCDTPSCVRPSHLFKGTSKDNTQDMLHKGRGPWHLRRGENHPRAKFTNEQVREIRLKHQSGEFPCDIAREFGAPRTTINNIIHGYAWKYTS